MLGWVFRNARARTVHGEATSNHPRPAQAKEQRRANRAREARERRVKENPFKNHPEAASNSGGQKGADGDDDEAAKARKGGSVPLRAGKG